MSENLGLGKLITDENVQRDAIHIAVVPVIAAMVILPGQSIKFAYKNNTDLVCPAGNDLIGVADPFLPNPVEVGQRFWMWLTPGSITSLRHDWTHPAFAVQINPQPIKEDRPEGYWRTPTVMALCENMRKQNNYEAMPILADALEDAGYEDKAILNQCRIERPYGFEPQRIVCLIMGGETEASVRWIEDFADSIDQTYNRLMDSAEQWITEERYTRDDTEAYKEHWDKFEEFWEHYEIVTGMEVKDKSSFFTCSC